ncbi:DUF3025 domain-containing protein [Amphibiibacter pelophylacis]|uniref:DUF3025 domain-containing protein n=1 Tax=Amphibiibacter pelophylacis TaxID=1799477 RepID=A0ACC6P303_9BURK
MPWTALDWTAPWFAPYAPLGQALVRTIDARGGCVSDGLNAVMAQQEAAGYVHRPLLGDAPGQPLHFVPQGDLPAGEAYETFIYRTGGVPTRDNLHDFLNGLMWLHHPGFKRQLNALQAAEIARAGGVQTRGPVRDALTLLDENGLILDAPPDLIDLLRQRRWADLLHGQRPRWPREVRFTLLGHALLEKLAAPYKSLTAHVWVWPQPGSLTPQRLATKPFLHLPVLGIPGWWPASVDPAFYEDAAVFRPLRLENSE